MYRILCTVASLYEPYSLLSNKFWMGEGGGWGVGGGEAKGPSWRWRIRRVEGEKQQGGCKVIKNLNAPEQPEQGD